MIRLAEFAVSGIPTHIRVPRRFRVRQLGSNFFGVVDHLMGRLVSVHTTGDDPRGEAAADAHERRVHTARAVYGPAPEIAQAWLHEPTGATGITTVHMHPDGGPIASHGRPLLDDTAPARGSRSKPERTIADVEALLVGQGWRIITRAKAARALLASGYHLGDILAAGHLLYLHEATEHTWSTSDHLCRTFINRPAQSRTLPVD